MIWSLMLHSELREAKRQFYSNLVENFQLTQVLSWEPPQFSLHYLWWLSLKVSSALIQLNLNTQQ